MMELIESAIPVIQQALPTGSIGSERGTAAADRAPLAAGRDSVDRTTQDHGAVDDEQETEAAELDATIAHLHRSLERLRTQHAQLTSGAILQQYQRQTTSEVENSRPATKVLSVQG